MDGREHIGRVALRRPGVGLSLITEIGQHLARIGETRVCLDAEAVEVMEQAVFAGRKTHGAEFCEECRRLIRKGNAVGAAPNAP